MKWTNRTKRFGALAGFVASCALLLQLGVTTPASAADAPIASPTPSTTSTPTPVQSDSALPTASPSAPAETVSSPSTSVSQTSTPTSTPSPTSTSPLRSVRPMAGELTTNDAGAPVITVPTTSGANIGGVYAPRANAPATTISVNNGTWSPAGTYTYKYSWYLCTSASVTPSDTLPAGCTQTGITGTVNTLSVTSAMRGKFIVAGVTATRATPAGSGVKYTKSTLAVREKPVNTVNPTISSANLSTAATYTANAGTWTGFGDITYKYAWYTCTAVTTPVATKPTACTLVSPLASSATYTPATTAAGRRLVVEVQATNDAQPTAVSKFSASTGLLIAPVANTAAPTLTMVNAASNPVNSKPTVGKTVTTTNGTWTGTATITYTYQWYRCDAEQVTAPATLPGDCVAVTGTGATAVTYTVQAADAGKYLLSGVRATNAAADPKVAFSKTAGLVTKSAVIGTAASDKPAISGDSKVGSTQTVTSGTWTGAVPNPTFTYEWLTCSRSMVSADTIPTGNACSTVQAVTAASPTQYIPKTADIGRYLVVKVTPVNGAPNIARYTASSSKAVGSAPANTVAPKFTTTSGVSVTIPSSSGSVTAVAGTWTGTPTPTLSILWYLCTSATTVSSTMPDSCRALTTDDTSNPSARTLPVSNKWAGKFLVIAETATNSFGAPTVWGASTGAINVPATLTQDPILTGNAVDGNVLGVTNVSTSGFVDPTVAYQWYRCTSQVIAAVRTLPSGCTAIASATSETYTLVYADAGKYISAWVRASNAANVTGDVRWTASTQTQVTSPAKNTVTPTLTVGSPSTTGKPRVGGTVGTDGGTWTGFPAVVKSYQWYVCDSEYVTAPTDVPADCTALTSTDSTTATLNVGSELVTKYLLVEVTGTSAGVPSAPTYSASTKFVTQAPTVTATPELAPTNSDEGDRRFVGQSLSAQPGTFMQGHPLPEPSGISFLWLRCTSAVPAAVSVRPAGCTALPVGANPLEYTTVAADAGAFITVEESRANEAGKATVIAATGSHAVAQTPTNSVSPTVTGSAWVGKVLTAANGTWAGPPAPTVIREWMSCPTALAAASATPPADCATLLDGTGAPITSLSYTVAASDEGKFILVKVTATNDKAAVIKYSASTTVIKVKPTVEKYPLIADLDQPGADSPTNSGIVGFAHTVTAGTWSGSTPLATPTYLWYLCTSAVPAATTTAPTGCTSTGVTTTSYTPAVANAGKYLTFTETRTNGTEPVTAWAASTPGPIVTAISAPSPVPVVSVVGGVNATTPKLGSGSSVTTTNGTWAATPAVSFRYQWFACATAKTATASSLPANTDCVAIDGATTQSFPLGLDRTNLIGKFLLVKVTAYHPLTPKNSRPIYSVSTTVGVQSKPQVKTASSISGVPYVEATLTAKPGDTYSLPAATSTYQWIRCTVAVDAPVTGLGTDALPANCANIPGATQATYPVVRADLNNRIAVRVIWKNSLDTTVGASSISKTTSPIVLGPVNRIAPTIQARAAGPVVGEDIRVQSAQSDWTGSPTFTYQWYSCSASVSAASDSLPGVCSIIDGAETDTFTVRSADERLYFVAGVTATNSDGQSTKFTASSTQTLSIPVSTGDPELTGKSFVGTRITASTGTWAGFPAPTYTYAWFVCDDEATGHAPEDVTCASTPVATTANYTPVASQKDKTLRVRVTATNSAGAVHDWTATTELIKEGPYIITPATIRGTADVSSTTPLTATPGSWGGNPYPVITGQWMRCATNQPTAVAGAVPAGCVSIEGQTELTYSLRAEDAGKFVTYVETAGNDYGVDYETSASTAQVTMPPTVSVEPRITGAPEVGGTLTRVAGTWIGFPDPVNPATGASTWWRCTNAVPNPSSTMPTGCTQITTNATGNSYVVAAADKGYFIVFREQKKNGTTGTVTVNRFTASTVVVTSPPVRGTDVVVTSTDRMTGGAQPRVAPVVGKTISYTAGTWTGSTDITHRWFRCTTDVTVVSDSVPADCVPSDAADAASPTYLVTTADLGYFLVSEETAANVAATRMRYSKSTLVVQELPSPTVAPTVTGSRAIGTTTTPAGTLTVNRGEWTGTANITTTVEWYRCSTIVTDSTSMPSTCSAISGQTGDSYTMSTADSNLYVTARVVAKNPATTIAAPASVNYLVPFTEAEKSAKAPSRTSPGFIAPTAGLVEDTVNGLANVGESFSVSAPAGSTGTWPDAAPSPTFSYAWYSCTAFHGGAEDTQGDDCVVIDGETGSELIITVDLADHWVRAKVTATNSAGEDVKYTATPNYAIAAAELHFTTEPSVSPQSSQVYALGTPKTVTADGGVWEPAGASQSFQWVRCKKPISSALYDNRGYGCISISGASSQTYTLQAADAGKYLSVVVTQQNATERRRVVAATTDMVLQAPALTTAQTLTGINTVGERITSTEGAWIGAEVPSKGYSWYRCDSAVPVSLTDVPPTCSLITGQTGASYMLTEADREKYISSFVTATNVTGTATSFSASTAQIRVKPVNLTAPSSTDRPYVGRSFTANLGTWDGFPAPTYQVNWFTCSAVVANPATSVQSGVCLPFGDMKTEAAGATTTTVTVPPASAQNYLMLKVTAVNAAGSAIKTSATSLQIWETPAISTATNATKPATTGTANVGQRISVNNGTWVGFPNPTPSYTWFLCDSAVTAAAPTLATNAGCLPTSTTTAYYDITLAEGGKFLVAGVTQTSASGTGTYFSASTVQIGFEPRATVAPAVTINEGSDKNYVTSTLSATIGTWTGYTKPGNPSTGSAYQWYACTAEIATPSTALPSGSICTAILGATNATFTLTNNEAGKHVAVFVTQENKLNATSVSDYVAAPAQVVAKGTKLSTSTFVRQAPIRVETALETMTGTANVGGTLTGSASTWKGFPTPAANQTGIEWFLCATPTTAVADCSLLADQTSPSISVVEDYAGKVLLMRSWGENSVSRTVSAGVKSQVISEAPVALTAPALSPTTPTNPATPRVGQSISTSNGTWRSTAGNNVTPRDTRTYTYTWYSCPTSTSPLSGCLVRGTADGTAAAYVPVAADGGRFITAVVKAKNNINTSATGTTTASSVAVANQSNVIGPVNYAPTNAGEVSLSASAARVDDTLTVAGESWTAEPAITSKSYQWYSCTSTVQTRPTSTTTPTGCSPIGTATSASYDVTTDVGGKFVMARVTATNDVGSTVKWTQSTLSAVTMAPRSANEPVITGTPVTGQTLTATTFATWSGFPTPTIAYRWFACTDAQDVATSSTPTGCTVITGQSTKTLVLTTAMVVVGKHIIFEEKATNASGSATRYSASLGPVTEPPPVVIP